MDKGLLVIVKVSLMIAATLLSLIAILYVLDVITAEHLRKLVEKTMIIMGVITLNTLVVIFLSRTGNKE